MITQGKVKVAAIQAAPWQFDKVRTVDKACQLIARAGEMGAKIILFPEAFIGGYPRGMTLGVKLGMRHPDGRSDYRRYYDNAIYLPGEESDKIGRAAAAAEAYVVMGVIEKEEISASLYCTMAYWGPDGTYLGKHRKVKPTAAERYIWAEDDGSSAITVIDTPYGKMGGLICWENYLASLRAGLYEHGISFYLAPTVDSRPSWQISMRHIAMESRAFVITASPYFTKQHYPKDLACYDELIDSEVINRGGSAIINPFGDYLAEPVYDREIIQLSELDLGQLAESRFDFDPSGHYKWPPRDIK